MPDVCPFFRFLALTKEAKTLDQLANISFRS